MAPRRGPGASKRNPTVLVTDSRDQQPQTSRRRRRQPPDTQAGPASSRPVTVDNVLQHASDVPSMQQRVPPPSGSFRVRPRTRIGGAGGLGGGGSSSAVGGSGGGALGTSDLGSLGAAAAGGRSRSTASGVDAKLRAAGRLASLPHLPPRSTKVSEKLVLLPETVIEEDAEVEGDRDESEVEERRARRRVAAVDEEEVIPPEYDGRETDDPEERLRRLNAQQQRLRKRDFAVDNEAAPLLAEEELLRRRRVSPEKAKSYAERLPKARRAEKLPRVTAYCTAQAYEMNATAAFVKEYHGGKTKLYDDCLYTAYHLPLLPGVGGYRVRSSPVVKSAEGKSLLDEEIERNEQRDYHEYFGEEEEHSVGVRSDDQDKDSTAHHHHHTGSDEEDNMMAHQGSGRASPTGEEEYSRNGPIMSNIDDPKVKEMSHPTSTTGSIPPDALSFAEMFVFSYGVVVFWNFSEREEKEVLADLAFSSSKTGTLPLTTNPLAEEDFETEEFHFQYSTEISRPRVYNDMITLRSGDHMIKLAISHGIAQSTKLSLFEEAMSRQMSEAKDVPRRLALTGHLGMKRAEVFRILGKLFKSRVEVNLSSNMLDVPNFFWDSEPTLHPLYIAVREYLEIKPRIQVLNERCRVFLDLTEILSDSIADNKESRQTWIIIILIFISCVVTVSEVVLRFGILTARSSSSSTAGPSSKVSFAENTQPGNLL